MYAGSGSIPAFPLARDSFCGSGGGGNGRRQCATSFRVSPAGRLGQQMGDETGDGWAPPGSEVTLVGDPG